jgi:hypothetical protein
MVKSLRAGKRVMASIRRFLQNKLKLAVNEKKSKVAPVEECSFLGLVLYRAKSGGVINPFRNSSGGYADSLAGAGLFLWNTAIGR